MLIITPSTGTYKTEFSYPTATKAHIHRDSSSGWEGSKALLCSNPRNQPRRATRTLRSSVNLLRHVTA